MPPKCLITRALFHAGECASNARLRRSRPLRPPTLVEALRALLQGALEDAPAELGAVRVDLVPVAGPRVGLRPPWLLGRRSRPRLHEASIRLAVRPAGWPKGARPRPSLSPSRLSSVRPASWPKDSGNDPRSFPTRLLGEAGELAEGVRQRPQRVPVAVDLGEAGELAEGFRQRLQAVPDEVTR